MIFLSRRFLIIASIFITCIAGSASAANRLRADEVRALQEIGKTLGMHWNFRTDPCEGGIEWAKPYNPKGTEYQVSCNCSVSPNDNSCHITHIVIKEQDLQGTLPRALVKLPYLQEIDLSRNYLSGTIPPEWGTLPFVQISLLGNRLTGSIPKELGNISTLTSLVLEVNQFSGSLPLELGNLKNLERLILNSNNFSGQLPATLGKLNSLNDFRISDNNFTGKIPDFIQNWPSLERLVIQASGLEGPIPRSIHRLVKLIDLRISDLNGAEQTFPQLSSDPNWDFLILRNCNIIGELPVYLRDIKNLSTLDLSFNKLNGSIPIDYSALSRVKHIYLTGNLLTGPVPDWMVKRGNLIDLSYNNFTPSNSVADCQSEDVNLFKGTASCLRSFQCTRNWSDFHINCGGNEVVISKTMFEEDTVSDGAASKFFKSKSNWALSSTGHFLNDARKINTYVENYPPNIPKKLPDLYMNARISPLSLTYYGFCLINGNYTVELYFAEIMFSNGRSFRSLGRRIFDVYIQEDLVLKDFNIEDAAGGAGAVTIQNFTAVVTDNTLEIRFQWAGKGTTSIPTKGVYGPLVSAISVYSDDFKHPSEGGGNVSAGAAIGIIAAVLLVISLVLGILWWKHCLNCRDKRNQELKGLDLQTGSFTLSQIKAATDNFSASNKIGEGGFGSVYKGILLDGTFIAVKQLSSKSKQGNREFLNEIGMNSALQHPHLVKLYGCCTEGNQLLLVYEFLENNSLARALFASPVECQLNLDWQTRHKICVGIARGLAYLHEESRLKIVHRDIKATNVLLDKDLNPKISDFGLAKLDEEDDTHISTRVAGTYGYMAPEYAMHGYLTEYMAPEYAMHGYLTDKADVYSFGIVALELVSGRRNTSSKAKADSFNLLDWAHVLREKGNLIELIDPRIGTNFDEEEVMTMIRVALLCTGVTAALRPTMSSVVSMLEGRAAVQEMDTDSVASHDEMKMKAMRDHFEHKMNESETHLVSVDGPSTSSSTPAFDLYPVSLGSDYWEQRNGTEHSSLVSNTC